MNQKLRGRMYGGTVLALDHVIFDPALAGGLQLFAFDLPAGPYPVVPPSLTSFARFSTDSFDFSAITAAAVWIDDPLVLPPGLVWAGGVLKPGTILGSTADVVISWGNLDPAAPVVLWPNPFRVLVAIFTVPPVPGVIVPP